MFQNKKATQTPKNNVEQSFRKLDDYDFLHETGQITPSLKGNNNRN